MSEIRESETKARDNSVPVAVRDCLGNLRDQARGRSLRSGASRSEGMSRETERAGVEAERDPRGSFVSVEIVLP